MAQHKCKNSQCTRLASGRNLFDAACWSQLPGDLQKLVRSETKKGEHSLRATPTREWLSRAMKVLNDPRRNAPVQKAAL